MRGEGDRKESVRFSFLQCGVQNLPPNLGETWRIQTKRKGEKGGEKVGGKGRKRRGLPILKKRGVKDGKRQA